MDYDDGETGIVFGGLIALLGAVFAAVVLYDVYADAVLQGNPLYTTLLENALPLVLDAGLVAAGFWIARTGDRYAAKEIAAWTGASLVVITFLALWVYGIQTVQGRIKPRIILVQIASAGALAGVTVGLYSSRQQRRRRQLSALFENASDCIAEIRFDDDVPTIQALNPAFEETFGYRTGTVRGESIDDVIVPADDRADADEITRSLKRGERFEAEVDREIRSGTIRTFRLQWVPIDAEPPVTRGYAVYTDVTDSRRYTERVDALHRATRDLIAAESPEAVARRGVEAVSNILGLSNAVIFAASSGRLEPIATSGVPDDIGPIERGEAALWERYDAESAARIPADEAPASLLPDGPPVAAEMAVPLEGFGVLWIGDPGIDTFDEEAVTLARILGNNVGTALERVAREQEVAEKNERLETFASVVSHDLRNPLSVADGYVDLAREETDAESLDRAARALDRMDSLIEELLTLARQGETIDEREPVTLSDLAASAWETAETEDATLTIEGDADLHVDPARTRQLLENLFRNAVEHGSTGSQTGSGDAVEHDSTGNRKPAASGDAVEHGSADDAVEVVVGPLGDAGFFVADDGPGIPPDRREEIFEHGYTTAERGTGFGLAIVEQVVDAHGGTVDVTESDAGGARFEIRGFGAE